MLTTLLIVCVVMVLVGGLVLRVSVGSFEPVRSTGLGLLTLELRRQTYIGGHPNGRGGDAFAQPCERRLRVLRLAGFPVWHQRASVDLPPQVACMIGTLTARDFDAEFAAPFRLSTFNLLTPAWIAGRLRRGTAGPRAAGTAQHAGRELLRK